MKVSVIGLGYVGLPTAVALAVSGHVVYGVDTNKARLHALMGGESDLNDPFVREHPLYTGQVAKLTTHQNTIQPILAHL